MNSLAFSANDVRLDGATLKVHYDLVNRSSASWLPENGWAAGYHLFDEPTGTLVVDGDRTPLSLAPSESRKLAMEIALPPEPGQYDIYVSVMREHVAWFYNEGWPFLLIDVAVDDAGAAKLLGWRIADKRSVARRRMMRGVSRAFTLPLESIWRNRNLIRTMVRRDVLSRYSGSFGGAFWAVLNPLMLMLTYFFVFGLVLQSRFGSDTSRSGFALNFLAGMLPWLAFSEAAGRSPFVMVEHRGFIKKLVFPVETLPVNLVASGLVTEFFG
ncbi:MAG TPA: ABC transporter permease, partial [Chloroflexota bacterium]|nr:ABC transporter permease [Chloroflexota bacterium]